MKNMVNKLLATCASLLLLGCATTENLQKISANDAHKMMMEEEVIIVDVRTREEFKEGHIENAINIPLNEITSSLIQLGKDTKILLYCRSGNRSAQATKKLIKLGYTSIFDFGGIQDWTYEIVK